MTSTEDIALPATALPAWQAYRRLLETKAAHFSALQRGEHEGAGARLAHQAHVSALLDEHSRAVSAFKEALQALTATDVAARDALLAAIARVNDSLLTTSGERGH